LSQFLFNGCALGQVSRLANIRPFEVSHIVGQELKGVVIRGRDVKTGQNKVSEWLQKIKITK